MIRATLLFCAGTIAALAAPVLTEILPRGVPPGQAFVLTVVGSDLGEGATVVSTLNANFTPVRGPKGETQFLVEPNGTWSNGSIRFAFKAAPVSPMCNC